MSIVGIVCAIPSPFSSEDRLQLQKTMTDLASAGAKFHSQAMAARTGGSLTLPQNQMNTIVPTIQPSISNIQANSQFAKPSALDVTGVTGMNTVRYSGQKAISSEEISELRKTIAQLAAQGGKGKFEPSAMAGGDPRFNAESQAPRGMSGYHVSENTFTDQPFL